ncbi:MAG: beta-ketoacyl-[acyl-carrier-protein] synthase family protein, partial [Candidatus Sumerlaeota bacterium]
EELNHYFRQRPELAEMDRSAALALIGAAMARRHANLADTMPDGYRLGVFVGCSEGPVHSIEAAYEEFHRGQSAYIKPSLAKRISPQAVSHFVAEQVGARSSTASTFVAGSASGLLAVAQAVQAIQTDLVDGAVVGGVEAPVVPQRFRLYDALRIMSRNFNDHPHTASRPFAADRDGFVLSEGCGFLVIEREKMAEKRGATSYGHIVSQGQAFPGMHPVDRQAACMAGALNRAKVKKSELVHVQAAACSSPVADSEEAAALTKILDTVVKDVHVSSIKSMIGETLGASGPLALIAVLIGMRDNFIPPTINLDQPCEDCDLNHVANEALEIEVPAALVNAFDTEAGYVSVVVRKG